MTKSQNTKKDLCITSEQLTEQWKKGELPEGFYYFKLPNGETMVGSDYCLATYLLTTHSDRCEVLGELPSYEEWQAKLEENAQLKELLRIILSKTKICYSMVFQKDIINAELNEALLKKIKEVLK